MHGTKLILLRKPNVPWGTSCKKQSFFSNLVETCLGWCPCCWKQEVPNSCVFFVRVWKFKLKIFFFGYMWRYVVQINVKTRLWSCEVFSIQQSDCAWSDLIQLTGSVLHSYWQGWVFDLLCGIDWDKLSDIDACFQSNCQSPAGRWSLWVAMESKAQWWRETVREGFSWQCNLGLREC